MIVVALALVAYGLDCPATSTADEAMQCCDTMSCSPDGHEHSEDCCKTMQVTHSPFVQTNSLHSAPVSFVLFAILPVVSNSHNLDFSTHSILTAHSHAPPISQSAVEAPLRI